MLLLALDTATPAVTVALHDGEHVLTESTVVGGQHGELLAPGIAQALATAGVTPGDLTDVAVGVGPGPFTGLRVGIVSARAFGDVLGVPLHGVCTLDVLAWQHGAAGPFVVATDARRKEVYWARYADARTPRTEPAVDRPADVATPEPVVGNGGQLYLDAFPGAQEPVYPSASALADLTVERLRSGGTLLDPLPLYLRRPDARAPGARKRVLPA
ncbi:MAG: tRNA (adenosine(37)-N6)-threonylcarbamoyltransferase complex dimerization subunit type 1 TsaB [Streptosporangiales bacterium]